MRPSQYSASDRRGRAAHDVELAAMRDPFLAEALEGFETVEANHASAVEQLQKRLADRIAHPHRNRWIRPAIAATLLTAVAATALLTLRRSSVPTADYPAVAVATIPPSGLAQPVPPTQTPTPAKPASTPHHAVPSIPEQTATIIEPPAASSTAPTAAGTPAHTNTHGAVEPDRPEYTVQTGEGSLPIDEVVVTAYGKSDKKATTGSTGNSGASTIRDAMTADPALHRRESAAEVQPEELASQTTGANHPFATAESMPSFQGGDLHAFRRWVHEHIHYQEIALSSGIQGRAVVSFVIDTLGRLGDIRILQSPDRSLSDEIVRVLKSSPRWEPGMQWLPEGRKKKVPVKYTIPIDLRRAN